MGPGEEEGRGEKKEIKKVLEETFPYMPDFHSYKKRWTNTNLLNLVPTNLINDDNSILPHMSILGIYGF